MGRRACNKCGKYWPPKALRCPDCNGAALQSISGRFFIEEVIGIDGEAITYLAEDRSEYKRVAMRVLIPTASSGARERLVSEVQVLRTLGGTESVPAFIDAGKLHTLRTVFTVQSFEDGTTLVRALERKKPATIVETVLEILQSVALLHDRELVHGALDPRHVLLTPEGNARLLDLRWACRSGEASGIVTTSPFLAPEQTRRKDKVCCATDVFTISAFAYWFLTGKYPYALAKDGMPVFVGPKPPLASSLNPHITSDLAEVLQKGLELRPGDRFSTAAEFRRALVSVFGTPTEIDLPSLPRRWAFPPWIDRLLKDRVRRHVAAACIGGAIGIGIVGIETCRTTQEPVMKPHVIVVGSTLPTSAGTSSIRVLAWPAAQVYLNGAVIGEAPFRDAVVCSSGDASIRIVSKTGREQILSVQLAPEHSYVVRADLESGTYSVKDDGL